MIPSLREKIVDSLVEQMRAIGTDPNDGYWFSYNVDRYSILGQQSQAPRIEVTARGGDASLHATGILRAQLAIELVVEVVHDLRRFPWQSPETETDRLIERAVTDVQRGFLRWVALDPDGIGIELQSWAWDREDPLQGRLETGAICYASIQFNHSEIDPRTQVYNPAELV